eukprot:186618-Amphidinium_carterae.1
MSLVQKAGRQHFAAHCSDESDEKIKLQQQRVALLAQLGRLRMRLIKKDVLPYQRPLLPKHFVLKQEL